MIRCAKRKLRKRAATIKSCLNNFLNNCPGRELHAMVSVMAVNIQLSSPIGVRRSETRPGMLEASWRLKPDGKGFWRMKNRIAISMGVVRQDVKMSAGSAGFVGRFSLSLQAARCTQSEKSMTSAEGSRRLISWFSTSCLFANLTKFEIIKPASEQSQTNRLGAPNQDCKSYKEIGIYWVYVLLKTHISPEEVGLGTPCPL